LKGSEDDEGYIVAMPVEPTEVTLNELEKDCAGGADG